MRRIIPGALAALAITLAIGVPAHGAAAKARPDLGVSAEMTLLSAPPARVGGGMWIDITVTNVGRGTAGDVRATRAASHNIAWTYGTPDLTGLPPLQLAPGASQSWTLYGSFANESDVEGRAWASYRFTATGERNPGDNTAGIDTEVLFGAGDLTFVAYNGVNPTLPGVGASFVYTKDGVEKTWRTIHTCASGRITVSVPGGRYRIRFTAPEGYRIRAGWEEIDLSVAPYDQIVLNTQVEPVVGDPPPPSPSTDPECGGRF